MEPHRTEPGDLFILSISCHCGSNLIHSHGLKTVYTPVTPTFVSSVFPYLGFIYPTFCLMLSPRCFKRYPKLSVPQTQPLISSCPSRSNPSVSASHQMILPLNFEFLAQAKNLKVILDSSFSYVLHHHSFRYYVQNLSGSPRPLVIFMTTLAYLTCPPSCSSVLVGLPALSLTC